MISSVTLKQFTPLPSVLRGRTAAVNLLSCQRNLWVSNDISNDVSPPVPRPKLAPLDDPPYRYPINSLWKKVLVPISTPNRHTVVAPVSSSKRRAHPSHKPANLRYPATRSSLLPTSCTVPSHPKVAVIPPDQTDGGLTSLHRCNPAGNANATSPLNLHPRCH